MIMDYKTYPTRWPILEFYLTIWHLGIGTSLMRPAEETMTYEYINFGIYWKRDRVYSFRLYDTYKRKADRLGFLLRTSGPDISKEKLVEILKLTQERIQEAEKEEKQ